RLRVGLEVPVRTCAQSLCGTHVYRAQTVDSTFWCEGETEPGARLDRGFASRSDRRLDCARDDFEEDRTDGATSGSERSARPNKLSADHRALFLRGRHAN